MLRDHAKAARIARDVVEQHRAVAGLALVEIHDPADLFLAIGALDQLQFVGGIELAEPGAQVLLGGVGKDLGWKLGDPIHVFMPSVSIQGPQAARSSAR